jgi:ATP-dependent helicase/nuclease subunit A
MCVVERGTPRPIEYRDIVILLRSMRYHADEYADVLRQRGIPVFNAGGGGYFDAMEVRDMLSLLRLLDNQQQDIPMAAVLRSPLSGLPRAEDALARIRLAFVQEPFHRAVVRYAGERQDELAAKLRDFLHELDEWRQLVRQRPVADLIWTIYERTGYLAFCNGLENGQQRCANLLHLYERARQFGTFSRQGLYRFIRFLESLREETDAAQAPQISEAENVVRIMSIHKSKGLEFPVVIVPEMGKRINFQGCSGNIVADRRGYLGLCAVDEKKRIRYPSLASMLVSERLRRQTIAEELRVLYVAMTRAKEHLILVGTCGGNASEKWGRAWDLHAGPLPPNTILSARTMLDWLGPVAAALSGDGGRTIQVYDHPGEEIGQWMAEMGEKREKTEAAGKLVNLEPLEVEPAENAAAARVIERLAWAYPHGAFSLLQASAAVTEVAKEKGGAHGLQASRATQTPAVDMALAEPRCLREEVQVSPAERGTAVHLFMEHLDFGGACDEVDLAGQRDRLVARKIMSAAQAEAVREEMGTVRWFLETDLGRLVRRQAAVLRRELALNYALPAERLIEAASGEAMDQVMVRGRIDLLAPDGEQLVLVDYKTDRVFGGALAERSEFYRPQMRMYREAMERITGRGVSGAYLVFLCAREIVLV